MKRSKMKNFLTLPKSGDLLHLEQICHVGFFANPPNFGITITYFSGHKENLAGEDAEAALKKFEASDIDVTKLRARIAEGK